MSANSSPLQIGVFGVGAIGQMVARHLDDGKLNAVLAGVSDQDASRASSFAAQLQSAPPVLDRTELITRSDWIVEAASQAALPALIPEVIAHRKNVLVMSVGGLLGHDDWFHVAARRGSRILFPSGAIAALDGLRSACVGRMDGVTLTSRKPVRALEGASFVLERGIQLHALREDTVIFDGPAVEAARAFPATSNVAAALALTVGDRCEVRVRIVASPAGTRNIHEIEAAGEFGRFRIVIENVPSEANPKTSKLAALSALAALASLADSPLAPASDSQRRPFPATASR
ncbi:MAG: aspartate dehydrogenase domain-containing protein [Candidatus Acidiferrales bacterium]